MPTPIGHAMAGYIVFRMGGAYKRPDGRNFLALCFLMAIIPDFDFLPGIFYGQPALYHNGISHSLGFAFGAGLIAAAIYSRKRETFLTDWSLFFLAYASHPVIDMFQPDSRPPFGVPLLWPIHEEYYIAPFRLFWGVHHVASTSGSTEEWIFGILDLYNVGAIGIEILVVLPLILAVRALQARKT
jgi:inner membrane protein